MTARDDYPAIAAHEGLEWRGASAQFGRALDEIDRLRTLVEALRWHVHKGDHPKANLTGDEWREVAFAKTLLHEAGLGDAACSD